MDFGETIGERGQAMVETALILLAFFVMFFAIFEGGRLIQVQQTLTDAARLGARLKVAPDSGTNNLPSDADVQNLVDSFLDAASIYGATTTVTPVPCNTPVGSVDCLQVTVTYDYNVMTIPMFGAVNMALAGQSQMRDERSQ